MKTALRVHIVYNMLTKCHGILYVINKSWQIKHPMHHLYVVFLCFGFWALRRVWTLDYELCYLYNTVYMWIWSYEQL